MCCSKLYILLFISNLFATLAIAENLDRRAAVMAEAMLNMMQSFGLFGSQSNFQMPNWSFNSNSKLDGMWIGNNGERLQIQGSNFYLQAPDGREISGTLQIHERMLMLYQPRFNIAMIYEYAIQDHRLALLDRQGNLMLYRRVQ